MDNRFTGAIPPVVTSSIAAGKVDFDNLDKVIEHLIAGSVSGLFALRSSGEVAHLTDTQRDAVIERVAKTVAGRIPVLAGAIDTTVHRAIDQIRRAAALDAGAIVATCPFYALNDAEEVKVHFRVIAAVIDVPVLTYDVPVRLGDAKLSYDPLVELDEEGILVDVEDPPGNGVTFRGLMTINKVTGHPLVPLIGHECVIDDTLLLGADGLIPEYGNVGPVHHAEMWKASREGARDEVCRLQDEVCAGFEIVFVPQSRLTDTTGIGAFKIAVEAIGIIATNEMAFPVKVLEGEAKEQVLETVRTQGLI